MEFYVVQLPTGRHVVLTFDMCSSSDILEDLLRNDAIDRYWELLTKLKHQLALTQIRFQSFGSMICNYKFTGDGWILLISIPKEKKFGEEILELMRSLSLLYQAEYPKLAMHLESPPKAPGINFGVDVGNVNHAKVFQRDEYIGRPINVACRLQSAIKDIDTSPAYKALVTKAVFNKYLAPATGFDATEEECSLRNINHNVPIQCVKLSLIGAEKMQGA